MSHSREQSPDSQASAKLAALALSVEQKEEEAIDKDEGQHELEFDIFEAPARTFAIGGRPVQPHRAEVNDSRFRNSLSDLEEFQEQGLTLKAVQAAVTCSNGGKRFQDQLVHREYRGRDGPSSFKPGVKQTRRCGARFKPVDTPKPGVAVLHEHDNVVVGNLRSKASKGDPPKDWLRVCFRTSGHMPAIELKVYLDDKKTAIVTIFGTNLVYGAKDAPIKILTGDQEGLSQIVCHSKLREAARCGLFEFAKEQRITKISLDMLGQHKDLEGRANKINITGDVTEEELTQWANAVPAGDGFGPRCIKAIGQARYFLAHMYKCPTSMDLYMGYYAEGAVAVEEYKEHAAFARYFTATMSLAADLGNFWWYRSQVETDWQHEDFPFYDLDVPRWQVTQWLESTDDTETNGSQLHWSLPTAATSVPSEPVSWAPCDVGSVWPGEEEAMFAARFGLADYGHR